MNVRATSFLVLGGLAFLWGCMGFGDVDPRETILIDYESHVQPLIEQHCADCHGDPPIGGSVTITDEASAIEHADRIHARAVIMGDMPPGSPLTTTEKRILDTWIRAVISTPADNSGGNAGNAGGSGGNAGGSGGATGGEAGMTDEERPPTWDNDIGPLFEQTCVGCHSAATPQSGLDLSTYEGITSGGNQGALIDTTDVTQSLLIDYLRGQNGKLQMPPGSPLSEAEIIQVEVWLTQGAAQGAAP